MKQVHTMSDSGMIEYAAQVKDCLQCDFIHDDVIEAMRHCYINGWLPCECSEYIDSGTIPERFINIVEI